jgi:hypothetical protein
MKKIFCGVALLLVAFVSGTMAFPQPGWAPAPEKTVAEKKEKFTGVIEKVDAIGNAIVVRGLVLKEEKTLTFVVSSKTDIRKGTIQLRMGDLKRAKQIVVEYQEEKNSLSALSIEVPGP